MGEAATNHGGIGALTAALEEQRALLVAGVEAIDRMTTVLASMKEEARRGEMPVLMTLNEVAKILNVGYSGAREWAVKGVIPSVRINREIRVSQQALEDWIAALPTAGDYDPIAIEAQRVRRRRRAG